MFSGEFFFQTRFLRRLCTDFLETLPHDVGSSAIENVPSTFSFVLRKREIRGTKSILAIFRTPHKGFAMSLRNAKKFYNYKKHITLTFTRYVFQTCQRVGLTIAENGCHCSKIFF